MNKKVDNLDVNVYLTRELMGDAVAKDVKIAIDQLLKNKDTVNVIFAAAPSQRDLYKSLLAQDIPWEKVNAMHMDEYVGIRAEESQSFRNYLKRNLFDFIPLRSIAYIQGESEDVADECKRYTSILESNAPDIVCMGIGENTHIAFNDPPLAKFDDIERVKVVELDLICRQQQVNDGCFPILEKVPTHALTLTIPVLLSAEYIFCVVPGKTKDRAVYQTIHEKIDELYPSTILRNHPQAKLYLDTESSRLLES
ncbi:MAG: 6-phosphogluconolactonase [Sphingobacterium sp.]|jgi:glucosamine-6-phosphate deaminase|nr:6-phosphogluconolactonase [Sphingobacterium sp.]